MRADKMQDYLEFYTVSNYSPYPGMNGSKHKTYECWGEVYEPSIKDIQMNNMETESVNVTVIIRDVFPYFVPEVKSTFTITTGLYADTTFNIKQVAPKEQNTIKIVGTKIWE